jgi:Tol biopolymer transport system component/serine/threonine protein kinase
MTESLRSRLEAALADRYDIERQVGQGGMATVFAAWDRQYERRVALKVLRPDIASSIGSDRFRTEARIVGQLSHPHVLPLREAGEADGLLYFSMPLAGEESLRQRLARAGRLSLRDALRITREVGDALAYAHDHGVVHRDVKPANVLLIEGHAVVADFGVASLVDAAGRALGETSGTLIGSPAFMSPEQVTQSGSVNHRSDQYSLACVLYEMLGGVRPVSGGDTQAILHRKLVTSPPSVRDSRRGVPRSVERALARALSVSPDDRFPSVRDFVEALGGPLEERAALPYFYLRVLWRARRILAASLFVLVAWTAVWWVGRAPENGEPSLSTSSVRQLTFDFGLEIEPAISPDGSTIAFTVIQAGGRSQVFLRRLDADSARMLVLDGTAGFWHLPRWTADGEGLVVSGFLGRSSSRLVPREGGQGREGPPGTVWDSNGDRFAYVRGRSLPGRGPDSVFVGGASGEDEQVVATGLGLHSAAWSPDGRWIAYTEGNWEFTAGTFENIAPSRLWLADVEEGRARVVAEGGLNVSPAWLPGSRDLLFLSDRDGPRDVYHLHLNARGVSDEKAERLTTGLNAHTFTVSRDGTRLYYSRLSGHTNVFALPIPDTGIAQFSDAKAVTSGTQMVENRGGSPDGRWVAYDSNLSGNQDIYLIPVEGGEPRRLTHDEAHDFAPQFSPDGADITWMSMRHGTRDIFVMKADGTEKTRVTALEGEEYFPRFSPDGLRIVFSATGAQGQELYEVRRAEPGGAWSAPRPLGLRGNRASWSPDGTVLAFDEARNGGIHLVEDGVERVVLDTLISPLRHFHRPSWSADGSRLYFCASDAEGWAIFEASVRSGAVRPLVRGNRVTSGSIYASGSLYECADVAAGRFIFSQGQTQADIYVMKLERR